MYVGGTKEGMNQVDEAAEEASQPAAPHDPCDLTDPWLGFAAPPGQESLAADSKVGGVHTERDRGPSVFLSWSIIGAAQGYNLGGFECVLTLQGTYVLAMRWCPRS